VTQLEANVAKAGSGALIQMCIQHGTNPLMRAIAKNELKLVAIISKQCHRVALNCEVGTLLICVMLIPLGT
jgi:hypothetical protein